jgi:hypothetical protein
MTAESVTLVLAVFCVCVCHFLGFFSARDRCPPANLLDLSAMYVMHCVHQRCVSCGQLVNLQKQKSAVKNLVFK